MKENSKRETVKYRKILYVIFLTIFETQNTINNIIKVYINNIILYNYDQQLLPKQSFLVFIKPFY